MIIPIRRCVRRKRVLTVILIEARALRNAEDCGSLAALGMTNALIGITNAEITNAREARHSR